MRAVIPMDYRSVKARHDARLRAVVYYAQRSDGAIKIGVSRNVNRRLRALRAGTGKASYCPPDERPLSIRLLATHDGGYPAERVMHRRFAQGHIEGEWFAPTKDLLAHIAALAESPVRE